MHVRSLRRACMFIVGVRNSRLCCSSSDEQRNWTRHAGTFRVGASRRRPRLVHSTLPPPCWQRVMCSSAEGECGAGLDIHCHRMSLRVGPQRAPEQPELHCRSCISLILDPGVRRCRRQAGRRGILGLGDALRICVKHGGRYHRP
jgi:hypothetical protein